MTIVNLTMMSWTTTSLLAVIVLQWILFTALLQLAKDNQLPVSSSVSSSVSSISTAPNAPTTGGILDAMAMAAWSSSTSAATERWMRQDDRVPLERRPPPVPLEGVAVTILFRAPKWFFLRYKVMIDNAIANLPKQDGSWKVQLFINEPWVREQLLPWHPALQSMLFPLNTTSTDSRLLVTSLPAEFIKHGRKPRDVMLSRWFWESGLAADRVLLFSGNGAFCGNQPTLSSSSISSSSLSFQNAWSELLQLDYVGVPSNEHNGIGGDGSSHSLRYRPAMLRVLDYHESTTPNKKIDGAEHHFFLDTMMRMNQQQQQVVGSTSGQRRLEATVVSDSNSKEATSSSSSSTTASTSSSMFRLATREQTIRFGGTTNLSSDSALIHLPLVVAGTQGQLTYAERDSLLKHCPELKVIFPSLHEPTCFGAHPKADTCRATICALQDPMPSHGC